MTKTTPEITEKLRQAASGTHTRPITFENETEVSAFRDITLLKSLYMEAATGMRSSRHVSAYSIAKREHNLRGNKQNVFKQLVVIMRDRHGIDLTPLAEKFK